MKLRILILEIVLFSLSLIRAESLERITMPYGQKLFVSGINVAWKQFGGDVGKYPVDTVWFAKMLQGVADSGGNAVRWWLFTDCSNDPQFDPVTKLVKGLESSTVANIKKVLDMGYARGVGIDLCLLSFDMMKTGKTMVDMEANKMILQTDAGRKAFIDNAVVPLVKAIGNHPAILNWEIFNEPEGMVKSIAGDWGSMADGIEISHIQKMVNQAAGAIHRAVPNVPVSNGCWAFIAGSNTISGDHNYYSDSALVAAGGDPDGTLDYYMVHYYEWAKTERSPFHHPASYWGLDKPLVIGEFPAKGLSAEVGEMTPAQCWKYLYDNGYAGAMGWTYTAHDGFGGLPEAGQGMRALKTGASSAVTLDFPPSANDDWYIDTVGKTLTIAAPGILLNDSDPTAGQKLTDEIMLSPLHGTATVKADGSFTYTPAPGWTGTDRFIYAANAGGSFDTASVTVRVLDPAKGTFFAPPAAKDWQIYAGWGKISVENVAGGMGVNNAQWGSSSVWVVGGGVPVQFTAVEHTISIQVKNDPGSPWAKLAFLLTTKDAVGNYGPTDTVKLVNLTAQSKGVDGFVEYRGTVTPKSAGAFLPAVEFVWMDTDGNGPNFNHQSVVRDLEIFPSNDFVHSKFVDRKASVVKSAISWNVRGKAVTVSAPGEKIEVKVSDLSGRQMLYVTNNNTVRLKYPGGKSLHVVMVRAGGRTCRFVLPPDGR